MGSKVDKDQKTGVNWSIACLPAAMTMEQQWDSLDGAAVRQVTAVVVGCGQRGT